MKYIIKNLTLVFFLGLLTMCQEDETSPRDYPRINTLSVSDVSESGATFNAEITYRGNFHVLSYGFVWSTHQYPSINDSERVVYAENIQNKQFSTPISTTLEEGLTYYVRPFIQTADYTVYGANVTFKSLGSKAPVIETVEPETGTIGDTLSLIGTNFSYLNTTNKVFFGNQSATLVSSTDTLVKVIVPVLQPANHDISLSIQGNKSTYKGDFELTTPQIKDIQPREVAIDDTLSLTGENFSLIIEGNLVEIGGIKSEVIAADKKQLKVIVPSNLNAENNVQLTIAGKSVNYTEPLRFLIPKIQQLSSSSVGFGEEVTIHGQHFSTVTDHNIVLVGEVAAEILISERNKVVFKVPEALTNAKNKLTYKVAGRELSYEFLQIKSPVIESIDNNYISSYENGAIIISGDNFNPILEKNAVWLGDHYAPILSATTKKLTVEFPRDLIPTPEISVLDTIGVQVNVLDQRAFLHESLIIDYQSTWTRMKDFPGPPRLYPAQFSIGEKGYIGLGSGDLSDNWYKDFWEYNPEEDQWRRLPDFPGTARNHVTTFVIDQKAYVIGGTKGNHFQDSNNLQEVWEFDGNTHTWTQKNDFPGGTRFSSFGFSLGGYGYMGGGMQGDFNAKEDFWKYDPSNDSWQRLNDLSEGVWDDDILVFSNQDKAYVYTNGNDYGSNPRSLFRYAPNNDTWIPLNSSPVNTNEMSGFLIGDHIYTGLGLTSNWAGSSTWLNYNINTDTWNIADHLFPGGERRTASSFTLNNSGYILLGKSGCHCANKNDVWKFTPNEH